MKNYKIRYRIEPWNKPASGGKKVADGITVSDDDYGFTDRVFLRSFVDGTVLAVDSEAGGCADRGCLMEISRAIDGIIRQMDEEEKSP